jgi:hypothetical protein
MLRAGGILVLAPDTEGDAAVVTRAARRPGGRHRRSAALLDRVDDPARRGGSPEATLPPALLPS